MLTSLAARYERHFRRFQFVTRWLPPALALPFCAWLARQSALHRREEDAWRAALTTFTLAPESFLEDYRGLDGVMEGASFYFSDFRKLLPGISVAAELADLTNQPGGMLILTYHHHFNGLLCAFLGHILARPVNVLAMNPDINPMAEKLAWYKQILYGDSEKQLAGGRYVWIRPDANNSLISALRDLLRRHAALVSVHDFGQPFTTIQEQTHTLLGRQIAAPVGAIAFALARQLPVYVLWLEWKGRAKFSICGKKLTEVTEQGVLAEYFATLEGLIEQRPAAWEGWRALASAPLVTP